MREARAILMKSMPALDAKQKLRKESLPTNKEAAIGSVIRGLTLQKAQACHHYHGNVVRILSTATECLVYRAIEMNLHESNQDRFLNRHLNGTNNNELLYYISDPHDGAERQKLLCNLNTLMEIASQLAASRCLNSDDLTQS